MKRQISSIGQIVLYFYFTEHLEEFRPVDLPKSTAGRPEAISQEALKATVTPGDALTHQTRYVARRIPLQHTLTTQNLLSTACLCPSSATLSTTIKSKQPRTSLLRLSLSTIALQVRSTHYIRLSQNKLLTLFTRINSCAEISRPDCAYTNPVSLSRTTPQRSQ